MITDELTETIKEIADDITPAEYKPYIEFCRELAKGYIMVFLGKTEEDTEDYIEYRIAFKKSPKPKFYFTIAGWLDLYYMCFDVYTKCRTLKKAQEYIEGKYKGISGYNELKTAIVEINRANVRRRKHNDNRGNDNDNNMCNNPNDNID